MKRALAILAALAAIAAAAAMLLRRPATWDAPPAGGPPPYPERAGETLHRWGSRSAAEWAAFYPATAKDPSALWTLEGRLVLPDGSAPTTSVVVTHETVGLEPGHSKPPLAVRASPDGRFRFDALPPGRAVRLRLRRGGYSIPGDFVEIPSPAQGEVAIPVVANGAVTGTIARTDGEPLGDWVVLASRPGEPFERARMPDSPRRRGSRATLRTQRTEAAYRLDKLPPGVWRIEARAIGWGVLVLQIEVKPGEELDLGRLEVPEGHRLDVRLMDPGGAVIDVPYSVTLTPDIEIGPLSSDPGLRLAQAPEGAFQQSLLAMGRIGDGWFRTARVSPGRYWAQPTIGEVQLPPTLVTVDGDTSATLAAALPVEIAGTVSPPPAPSGGLLVSARSAERLGPMRRTFALGPDRAFRFEVAPGPLRLTAREAGATAYPAVELFLPGPPPSDSPLLLRIPEAMRLAGRFLGDAETSADAETTLWHRDRRSRRILLQPDTQGAFDTQLPAARYDVFDRNRWLGVAGPSADGSTSRFDYEFRRADLAIEVRDPQGRVVPHAAAYAMATGMSPFSRETIVPPFSEPREDGLLLIERLVPGEYEVVVAAPGFARQRLTARLEAERPLRLLAPLQPSRSTVRLRVIDGPTGAPMPGAYFQRAYLDGAHYPLFGATTDADGWIELRDLVPGSFAVDMVPTAAADRAPQRLRFDIEEGVQELAPVVVPSAGYLGIAALTASGAPIEGARLRLIPLDPADTAAVRACDHHTDAGHQSDEAGWFGHFALPINAPVQVLVELPDGRAYSLTAAAATRSGEVVVVRAGD
ncbi:MAG: hypothetical protein SF028_11385 [Candidatus Sumerlaeia bacterium]|nr:hypothetical protein [Candidatus Sumerlaeia bacterium]